MTREARHVGWGLVKRAALLTALLLLAACGGFLHDETLVGRYKLVAVDTDQQMGLCWSYCAGIIGVCGGL